MTKSDTESDDATKRARLVVLRKQLAKLQAKIEVLDQGEEERGRGEERRTKQHRRPGKPRRRILQLAEPEPPNSEPCEPEAPEFDQRPVSFDGESPRVTRGSSWVRGRAMVTPGVEDTPV
jgi:hypothetical protein